MQFYLLRFMLDPKPHAATGARPLIEREAWLRHVFGSAITFLHHGVDFHYRPDIDLSKGEIIVGRVGRLVVAVENKPPEANFAETEHEGWRAALVLIDPRSHDNGQRAAVEMVTEVGRPLGVIGSLAESINARVRPEPYYLDVNAISEMQTFWDFERENRGQIVNIVFELHVPNMFGIRDDLDKELRDLRDNERARRAKLEIQNEDGLNLQTERVQNTVAHTLDGGGAVKARTTDGKRFNSRQKVRRESVEVDLPTDEEPPPFAERVRRAIAAIFKL
jgi:hypothetical protein